jgi:hypothetical protein
MLEKMLAKIQDPLATAADINYATQEWNNKVC